VGPREDPHVGRDRPDIIQSATVDALAAFEDLLPHRLLLEPLHDGRDFVQVLGEALVLLQLSGH